jgi:poly(3-hydroxybutyrate) depolymerase
MNLRILSLLMVVSLSGVAQPVKRLERWLAQDINSRPSIANTGFSDAALSKKEAAQASKLLLADMYKRQRLALQEEWNNKRFIHDNDTLKFEYKVFGTAPTDGRSLYISMHGGGNTRPAANDQQWQNQIRLYTPAEGIYVAPRAPTNTWNLWHESHIDTLFARLILAAVIFEGVSPDKVYIMGYSAGGDGVYQLATRMADHWAAAAMMAGHPNETTPDNLRNIGFTLHMGALDNAYNRNNIARRWGVMLDSMRKADPGGYAHLVSLHEGRPHWMNREDTVAVPWMAAFKRNTLPSKIAWKQDDVHRLSFYWLAVPKGSAQTGGLIVASVKKNVVDIERNYSDSLIIRFNDQLVNLDKPVTINFHGKRIFKGKLKRSLGVIHQTISERKDPGLIFSAQLLLVDGKPVLPGS